MKKWVELFKELRKTSKGKAILFFGGYLIFFVIVILFVRLSSKDMTNPDDYQKGNSSDINIDLLLNNNYLFTYNVVLDNKEYIYYGKRNNDVELFSIGDKTYYKNGDSYFTKNNDLWVKTENYTCPSQLKRKKNIWNDSRLWWLAKEQCILFSKQYNDIQSYKNEILTIYKKYINS